VIKKSSRKRESDISRPALGDVVAGE